MRCVIHDPSLHGRWGWRRRPGARRSVETPNCGHLPSPSLTRCLQPPSLLQCFLLMQNHPCPAAPAARLDSLPTALTDLDALD